MAVKIRLTRIGMKKAPYYRVVAADDRYPRDGRFLETLGSYNPRAKEDKEKVQINMDRINYWLERGAQPSVTVRNILKAQKTA